MLIIGCGYIGQALARAYVARGERVVGVVRSAASTAAVAATGAEPLQLDLTAPLAEATLARLDSAGTRVFHLAPPPSTGATDPLTANLLAAFAVAGPPRRILYVGTTGVYGDCGGAWVDEDWPLRPAAERSHRRLDAERQLQAWSGTGGELVILRVAGIYACDRLPLARIRSAQPVVTPDQAPWSNRIHADDLVQVCEAAMERAHTGAVYNVADGHPSTMTDYFFQVADAAGLPRPPTIPLESAAGQVSAGMLSYLQESRRLSNRRLVEELGVKLRYPTLADGLADCFPPAVGAAAAG
ncbi:MAG: SDR family oxidoreductase [Chromatiaceae bacterium]|nr:MAG: SDR family oxidoreductase [Chromatiaceae bacterium]